MRYWMSFITPTRRRSKGDTERLHQLFTAV